MFSTYHSSFFLKDDLHLTPTEVAALSGIVTLPWLIKPLYGFLSDSLPIFGYRRRSYLIVSSIIGAVAWLSLAGSVSSSTDALIAATASSLSVALSDVVADSLVVERARDGGEQAAGALQSLCWTFSSVGGLLSAYLSGLILEHVTARTVFGWTAVCPIIVSGIAGLIAEERVPIVWTGLGQRLGDQSRTLWNALRQRRVFFPAMFLFLWQSSPSADSAMFFFSTNVLHFGPEFLGRVKFASSAAALFGLLIYRQFLRDVSVKTLMFWATLVSVPLGLTQLILVTRANVALGISDQIFALTDTAVLAALGYVAFMPTLVLAAQMCPPGIEGTLFAALMSIYNASGTVSNELGALVTKLLGVSETNFDNLWLLVLICNFSSLLPLPLLGWVDEVKSRADHDSVNNLEDEAQNSGRMAPIADSNQNGAHSKQPYTPQSKVAPPKKSEE